jgi:DNA mismatch repair protein MutS
LLIWYTPNMKETPLMAQYNSFKKQYPDKILLFRMGDFYETFGDDAIRAAKILNITLTSRDKKTNATALAGFPHHALDQYLPKLVNANESVVIVDQVEDPKLAKGIVKRAVTRVVTPGTLDGEYASEIRNSYLMALFAIKKELGVAIIDVSTGKFQMTKCSNSPEKVVELLNRYNPAEVLLIDGNGEFKVGSIPVQILEKYVGNSKEATKIVTEFYKINSVNSLAISVDDPQLVAVAMILNYVIETQRTNPDHIELPEQITLSGAMVLDSATIRNLDLVANSYSGQIKNSLFETLDATQTRMGRRMLYAWVLNPLVDYTQIQQRLDTVELLSNLSELEILRESLKTISDVERIVGKIGLNRANGRDLKALQYSLEASLKIHELLEGVDAEKKIKNSLKFNELFIFEKLLNGEQNDNALKGLITRIEEIIADNAPNTITEGGIIKTGYNTEIDELRAISTDSKGWVKTFAEQEKAKTGIPSLKIGFNRVFGYYIEVTKIHIDKVPESYVRKQTLVNCERYITEELKAKEDIILNAEGKLASLEYKIFSEFRSEILKYLTNVRELGSEIAKLDILSGFAKIALERQYTKPVLHSCGTQNRILKIKGGRHPVIERLTEQQYVSNDTELFGDTYRMAIITGPNMSGKSTYVRQIALIVIMAQIGSFVSSDEMEFSLIDRVFSRVGAADDLSQGRSTFMVEMEESANILNNASVDSLVILDEVGRGTSTYDGVSLAWAMSEFLVSHIACLTFFATHYHELLELAEQFPQNVKNYNVYVKEDKEHDEVVFMRKIVEGGANKSYGVYVAKLAGIPKEVVKRATQILSGFEGSAASLIKNQNFDSKKTAIQTSEEFHGISTFSGKSTKAGQISFFDSNEQLLHIQKIKALVENVDISQTRPAEAIDLLEKIKEKLIKL